MQVSAIALLGATLLTEAAMMNHAGYQPWWVRARLERRARERVNLQPLRDAVDEELTSGHRTDEARVVIVARSIASSIAQSSLWRAEFLDRHELRYDVEKNLTRIARDTVDLRGRLRAAARNAVGPQPANPRAIEPEAWRILLTRLAWMRRYHVQLLTLAAVLDAKENSTELIVGGTSQGICDEIRFTIIAIHQMDDIPA